MVNSALISAAKGCRSICIVIFLISDLSLNCYCYLTQSEAIFFIHHFRDVTRRVSIFLCTFYYCKKISCLEF